MYGTIKLDMLLRISDSNENRISYGLTKSELQKLELPYRQYYKYIDLSTFKAFFDVVYKNSDKNLVAELIPRRYYFHIPTGWILSLEPNLQECKRNLVVVCKRLYLHTMIKLLIERSKPETVKERIRYWLRKLGYRMIFCTHRTDKHTTLLSIARHISIKPKQVTSRQTLKALVLARKIAKKLGLTYPNIALLDKLLLKLLITNELKYLKRLEDILERIRKGTAPQSYIFKP